MKKYLIILFLTPLLGCGTVSPAEIEPLLTGAEQIKVGKSDPLDNYIEVGPISVKHGHGCGHFGDRGSYEGAITMLKNKAKEIDADYIQIMTITEPNLEGRWGPSKF